MCTENTVLQSLVFKNKIENVVYHNTEQKTVECKAVIKLNLKKSSQKITEIGGNDFRVVPHKPIVYVIRELYRIHGDKIEAKTIL